MMYLLLTFMVLAFAFYEWQYFMVFTPTYYRDEDLTEEFELLNIFSDDKIKLEGVVYEPKAAHSTLLFFAGRSHDSVGLIKKLSVAFPHTRIVTFNYRSYGKSGGHINEQNILNDGTLIASFVQKRYGNFYILGYSIGASVASYVASKEKSLELFLIGAFDSMGNLASQKYGINISSLLRYSFDNMKFLSRVEVKTYIFASKDDETVYIQNARNLKKYIKNLVLYKELERLNHKELLWDGEVVDEINKVIAT